MPTMQFFKSLFFAALLGGMVLLNGCSTISPKEPTPDNKSLPTDTGEKLLEAIRRQDYPAFAKQLPSSLAQLQTPEAFQEQCNAFANQFGIMQRYELLTELETPAVRHYIYKVAFERNGSDNSPIRQEILFRLVTGELNETEQIICFGFL